MTALMIGWGVFWLLIWIGLAILSLRGFVIAKRDDLEKLKATSKDLLTAAIFGIPISIFWIVAWVVVRALA